MPGTAADSNPASNPIIRWEDAEPVRTELALLVKRLEPVRRSILLELSRAGQVGLSTAELMSVHGIEMSDINSAVERVNTFAESFGYLPLIIGAGEGWWINSPNPGIVEAALAETERYQ
jgi:hypothetical protein